MGDLSRLKEAILYVAELCVDDAKFGAVKLNKILYYADFRAYRELGHSITGSTYQHLDEGPAPRELLPAREELLNEGAIDLEERPIFSFVQHRTVARRRANREVFQSPADDLLILRDAVEFLWDYWGNEVTAISHNEWGYRLTDDGEEIPYRTAWLSPDPPTQEQILLGQRIWKEKHG